MQTLGERLTRPWLGKASTLAIISEDGSTATHADLQAQIEALWGYFDSLGINRRSRIASIQENGVRNSISLLALAADYVVCPLSPRLVSSEYRALLEILDVSHLLIDHSGLDSLRNICSELEIGLVKLPTWVGDITATPSPSSSRSVETESLDIDTSIVLLTSGSTGQPKRVALTHKNLLHSCNEIISVLDLTSQDRCLSMWEQYHIGGIVDVLLAPILSKGSIQMTAGYDRDLFFKLTAHYPVTWFQCVPTTLHDLLRHTSEDWDICQTGMGLRFIRCVAAALPEHLQEIAEQRFQVPVIQTYGMTEAAPLITSNLLGEGGRRTGSVGRAAIDRAHADDRRHTT